MQINDFILKLGSQLNNTIDYYNFIIYICSHLALFKNNNEIVYNEYLKCIHNSENILDVYNFNQIIADYKKIDFNNDINIITAINNIIVDNKLFKNIRKEIDIVNYDFQDYIKFDENKYSSVLNLFSNNGSFLVECLKNKITYDKITCYENNDKLNDIAYYNIALSANINLKDSIITTDILYDNCIKDKYNLIICDIPTNFKNIIYANCNNLIKNLKIRGTKAEPLILQLILQLINKNGTIIIIIPNSLLFNESYQHVETRRYLIDNFNIVKIVELENKKSLLIIKNNNDISDIEVVKDNTTFFIKPENINKTNYSLFFHLNKNKSTVIYEKVRVGDIINISAFFEPDDIKPSKSNIKLLYSTNFNTLNCEIINLNTIYNYIFFTQNETILKQEFLNIYFYEFLKKNIDVITKGKMKKMCRDLINELFIDLLPIVTQDLIIKQYNLNIEMIETNNKQILNYQQIKREFIGNMIYTINNHKLLTLFNITNTVNDNTKLCIKKNSLTAGTVEYINDSNMNNTNYFFLDLINTNDNYEYFYYIFKYYQPQLNENAIKNNSIGLSKTFLESFEIPIISEPEMAHLIHVAKYFYTSIEFLTKTNETIIKDSPILLLL